MDFNGANALAEDEFQGYTGGSFAQIGATTWEIRSAGPTETLRYSTRLRSIRPTSFA